VNIVLLALLFVGPAGSILLTLRHCHLTYAWDNGYLAILSSGPVHNNQDTHQGNESSNDIEFIWGNVIDAPAP